MPACGPVQPDTWRILPQPLYAVLAPQMVLAADGLHPNFTGVSLLSWNVQNLLLRTRKPHMKDWREYVLPCATSQLPAATPPFAQTPSPNVLFTISQHMGDRPYRTCPSATSQQPVTPFLAQVLSSNLPSSNSKEQKTDSPVARTNAHRTFMSRSAQ